MSALRLVPDLPADRGPLVPADCWCGWAGGGGTVAMALLDLAAHMTDHTLEGIVPASAPEPVVICRTPIPVAISTGSRCRHCGSHPADPPFPEDQCPRCEPRLT